MNILPVKNPFGAPVYFKKTVASTMDEARLLAQDPSGTVIAAGEQRAGRGRAGRLWKSCVGESLSFTVILQYGTIAEIPRCLTLKTGLAVSYAIEDFMKNSIEDFKEGMRGKVTVKWPNDVMLSDYRGLSRKAAGILTEAVGGTVYIGIGINIAQKSFPPELAAKACSIAQAMAGFSEWGKMAASLAERRFTLLEMILSRLHKELETPDYASDWRERLEEKLYLKGQKVCFVPGLPEELADKPLTVRGILQGIGEDGGICIKKNTGGLVSFAAGELRVYA